MRLVVVIVLACGCRDTQVRYPRDIVVARDALYVTIDREESSERSFFARSGDGDRDYREHTEPYGVVEVDLATAACRWRDGRLAVRDADRTVRPFEPTAGLTLDAPGESFDPARLVHVPSGRAIELRDRASVLVAGDRILARDRAGTWLVLDDSLHVRDTIAFALGPLAAIAPGRAVFDSPGGAIAFHDDRNTLPQRGVRPPRAVDAWWAEKQVLAAGQETVTPHGVRLRAIARGGGKVALEVSRSDQPTVYEAASVTYFAGTRFVSLGDALVDVEGSARLTAPVRDVIDYDHGVYLRLADGAIWFTSLHHRIDTAEPLAVELQLATIRGDRYIFHGQEESVFVYDARTRTWVWRSYRDCIPGPARR